MTKIYCPKCKKEMINKGNVSEIVYTSNPPQWDEVYICEECKTKKTIRVWGEVYGEEADLLEARRKHKDLDNRSYLLGYNDAVVNWRNKLSVVSANANIEQDINKIRYWIGQLLKNN